MKSKALRTAVCLFAMSLGAPAWAQETVRFSDLSGWWSADPVHAGESSHVALQFLETNGKPEARFWMMDIGGYDIPLGEVVLSGNSIDFKPDPFPLTWNPTTQTLIGKLPADAAPVYDIPVEFHRSAPAERPAPRDWKALPQPKVRWSVDTGASVWAGLELDAKSGLLFVGNEQGDLYAIDRHGKVSWRYATGKPIRAQPKVIGNAVYVSSDSGYLYKLDTMTGVLKWRAPIGGTEPRLPSNDEKTRWDRYGSSIMSNGSLLYIASRDKNLYALDSKTGRELWHVAADDIMTATPALYRDLVIFADYAGKVRAVSAKDGSPRWIYDAKRAIAGDVVMTGDRVLVGSRSYDLIALDAASGRELWKSYRWFSWIESPPVVRDGVLYTGSSDATNIYALNLADGSLRWKMPVPGYSWQRIAMTDELLITGTLGKGVLPDSRLGSLFALDRKTGAIRWMFMEPPSAEVIQARKNWGFAASPVAGDGVVYAADFNGRVYALE